MEKYPIRNMLNGAKMRIGQLILGGMEKLDDALDVFPEDEVEPSLQHQDDNA